MQATLEYRVSFLEGTCNFVLEEILEKYPNVKIISKNSKEIIFKSEINDIDEFRNLLSPTHIECDGKKINVSNREWRKEYISAGINPSLAYVMCMVAELNKEDIVYDPFCGSSVIPITALKYFNVKKVLCSDVSGDAIGKSKINFKEANIDESKYKLFRSDIKDVRLTKQNIDKIISNLPFGIRVGNHSNNVNVYEELEVVCRKILRKRGKIVLLTQEKMLLRNVFKKDFWKVKSVTRVNEGGLLPEIFEIERA